MKATTVQHNTLGKGNVIRQDSNYCIVQFPDGNVRRFRNDSTSLSGVPSLASPTSDADDSWKRVSIHGDSAGFQNKIGNVRRYSMEIDSGTRRTLGTKSSSVTRDSLSVARRIAPECLTAHYGEEGWGKSFSVGVKLNTGNPMSAEAVKAVKIVLEALDRGAIDRDRALELCKKASRF